jgi:C_GCAxxG_C_C family probable redox protein
VKKNIARANELFSQGFNCAQAILGSFAPQLELTQEQALKLASPFGGGIARRGHICGAVSGSLMALGLKMGAATPEEKDAAYKLAGGFMREFEARHGSLLCRELIGCDLTTPDGLRKARESKVFETICPGLVEDAARIVASLMR